MGQTLRMMTAKQYTVHLNMIQEYAGIYTNMNKIYIFSLWVCHNDMMCPWVMVGGDSSRHGGQL
jgi:hypothetical protein